MPFGGSSCPTGAPVAPGAGRAMARRARSVARRSTPRTWCSTWNSPVRASHKLPITNCTFVASLHGNSREIPCAWRQTSPLSTRVIEATPIPEVDSDPGVTTTLGTILCAGVPKVRTSEASWVALVQSVAAGDQLALRDLYGRSHAIVFTLIMRIVRDKLTAEELTLDVFHDIWKRARSYDVAGGTVVGWIMNQARSRAIDRMRFESRKKRVDPHPDAAEPATESDADAEIDSGARDRQLRVAVSRLAFGERSAIELAFFSEFTYGETAVRLNEPVGTVKSRIRSGLDKLRHALAGGGLT
jgi:RNA polymerase sigma-70 factor (ECF subfamily)